MSHRIRLPLFACIASLVSALGHAHSTGENYVWLNVEESHLSGRFEIRLTDLREAFALEIPDDLDGARAALLASADEVERHLAEKFAIYADGEALPLLFTEVSLFEADNLGHFAQYHYRTPELAIPPTLTVRNDLFFGDSRLHRSLVCIEYDRVAGTEYGAEFTAMVFSPSNNEQVFDRTDVTGLLRVRDFVWQGVLHIWIGIDHVLFLVVLLLPAVLVRRDGDAESERPLWQPVASFRDAFWTIVKIVTTFTVAHTITLSLAALDIIRLPSRLIESTIALSIILIAINNLFPKLRETSWIVIFFFGLFHGLGFASVMGDLPFRMNNLVKVLAAFNIGVELGQIAIVAALFPVLFALRRTQSYRPAILVGGSVVIAAVATYWFVERALGFAG